MLQSLARLLPFGGAKPSLVWVTPELALCGRFDSSHASSLAEDGVGAVLDLRAEEQHDAALLAKAGLHYLHLPVPDHGAPSEDELSRAADWVLQELSDDRKAVVHCRLGLGRSVTVVIAVLLRMGYPLEDAADLVRRRRPTMTLSDAQVESLRKFAATPQP